MEGVGGCCLAAASQGFIFASSCAAQMPISPYGVQKRACEYYLGALLPHNSMALRFFNIYGPGQSMAYAGVVKKFLDARAAGAPLTIFGTGHQVRCYVHVGDVVRAIIAALETEDTGVVDIADPEFISVEQIAGAVGGPVKYADALPDEMATVQVDIQPTREMLRWEPQIKLLDWIKKEQAK